MKKYLIQILCVIAMILSLYGFSSCAESVELIFELSQDGQSYILSNIRFSDNFDEERDRVAITIPKEYNGLPVSAIGDEVFSGSHWLTKVTIPDTITSIGDKAFAYCQRLQSIDLPDALVSIGSQAFSCFKGSEIDLPDSLTYIGTKAFSASNLTSVTIPANATLGEHVFLNCEKIETATYKQGATCTGVGAFSNSMVKTVVLPDSITHISDNSFSSCYVLTTINFPEGLVEIGERAFSGDAHLTNVVLPNSLKRIGDYAFSDLVYLESISIPQVDSIGDCAFEFCNNLATISLADGIQEIQSSSFRYTAFARDESNWKNGLLYIGTYLIDSTYQLGFPKIFRVKDGTITIASGVFYFMESDGYVQIPASVTRVCGNAIATIDVQCEAEEQPETWAENWYNDEFRSKPPFILWGQDF